MVEAFPRRVSHRRGVCKYRVMATDQRGNRYLHPARLPWPECSELAGKVVLRTTIDLSRWEPYPWPKFGSPADVERARKAARAETAAKP